jgi:peptidoglycan/xylan/chitin deacetylase (PgdA/CDA1 family)
VTVERPDVFVSTSWDDGHVLDHRLADVLDRYGIPATFYVAPRNVESKTELRLDDHGVRALAERFEIGGHTLHHYPLPTLPDDEARQEILDGKTALEQVIGKPLTSFCYPRGEYGPQHVTMVAEAGFQVARTVDRYSVVPTAPFEMATSVNAYRHLVDGPHVARLARFRPRRAAQLFWNWDELAMAVFDQVMSQGGVYHFWGHSWEVDLHGDWQRLERVLAYIGGHSDVRYVTNSDLPVLPSPRD